MGRKMETAWSKAVNGADAEDTLPLPGVFSLTPREAVSHLTPICNFSVIGSWLGKYGFHFPQPIFGSD